MSSRPTRRGRRRSSSGRTWGTLSAGAEADIAVLNLRQGSFGFIDTGGGRFTGAQKLECELTVKGGQVVWDLNGISRPMWTDKPEPGKEP